MGTALGPQLVRDDGLVWEEMVVEAGQLITESVIAAARTVARYDPLGDMDV